MAGSKLTQLERQVLGGLMLRPGARIQEKTVEAVAARMGMSTTDVAQTLRQLQTLDPPLVHREVDAKLNIEFWIALHAAIEALEAPQQDQPPS